MMIIMKTIHLVLHIDINETCVIGDEAGGDTRDDCINKMLAKSSFVQIPSGSSTATTTTSSTGVGDHVGDRLIHENGDTVIITRTTGGISYQETSLLEPTHWWNGLPIQKTYKDDEIPPPVHTDWEWPVGCCPYYRTKYKDLSKTFLQHHGSIYKELSDQVEKELAALIVSSDSTSVKEVTMGTQERAATDSQLSDEIPILSHIIPALWETLVHISTTNPPNIENDGNCIDTNHENTHTNKGVDFTIVFRTMGTDLPQVAKAVTAFAQGRHPQYPSFKDSRLILQSDDILVGRWAPAAPCSSGHNSWESQQHYVYQLWKGESMVASGDQEVLEFIHRRKICGIQDDYKFWERHHHEPWAGKPVWIPKPHPNGWYYHHLLLDDNIHNLLHDSIASIRKENVDGTFLTLSSCAILDQHGLHLLRVPTIEPVLNPDWFIVQITKAQEKFIAQYMENDEK